MFNVNILVSFRSSIKSRYLKIECYKRTVSASKRINENRIYVYMCPRLFEIYIGLLQRSSSNVSLPNCQSWFMHFQNWIAVKYAPWFLVNFARDLSLCVYNSITRGNILNPNGLYIYFNPSNLLDRIIHNPLEGIVVLEFLRLIFRGNEFVQVVCVIYKYKML